MKPDLIKSSKLTCALCLLGGCAVVSDLDRFTLAEGGTADAAAEGGTADAAADAGTDADGTDAADTRDADLDAETDTGINADADADADAGVVLSCENPRTLCVRLEAFSPHVGQAVNVDLVSGSNGLRARSHMTSLRSDGTADFVLPLAIPESDIPRAGEDHPLHLEVWADLNDNGTYEADADHDWVLDLPADGNRRYVHGSDFEPLDPPTPIGGDFVMHFTGMSIHDGQQLEVMVIEDATGRTVGLHRLTEIDADEFDIVIPGIIDVPNVVYRVEFYADANDDESYDDPPDDHAWIRFGESNNDGLELTFDHGFQFDDLSYQFDFAE